MVLVYVLLILILIALGVFLFRLNRLSRPDVDINKAIELLIRQANEKLGSEKSIIQTDLTNKKDSIEKMVKQVLDELTRNQNKLELAEKERVGSFNGLRQAIENNQRLTEQLKVTADSLKNVLSNNQLRGSFGEKVAEDLLKQSGFVIGTNYTKQKESNDSRPDFTVFLPDKTKINVDCKFPYSNIVKMSETDDTAEKARYLKLFETNIKQKITDVSTRNYINPEDNTVDFVIVFIPNEMIFSFIYEKFPDILEEAFSKKIIFAGPFSFTAILRMVNQAYENFRYQKNVQAIIGQIRLFEKEFSKYNEEFTKLGDRIESLNKQYTEVNTTRTNKLIRSVDKIKIEDSASHALPE